VRVHVTASFDGPPPDPDTGSGGAPSAPSPNRRGVVIAVVITVLVLAGAGVGIYFLTKDDDPGNTASSAPQDAGRTSTQSPDTGGATSEPAPNPSTEPSQGPADPDDAAAARQVADQAIAAINNRDADSMRKISCDPESVGSADEIPPDASAKFVSGPEIAEDKATVQVEITVGGQSSTVPMPLAKVNGTWCVN
jgi:hypothetical protein